MSAKSRNHLVVLLILFIVLLSAILINPSRNILFHDDFAYAWSVRELVENHRLIISNWAAAAIVFQVFWGAIFCLPFGFSFAAINISTIIFSAIGLIAFFYLLGELGFTLKRRLVSVLVLFSSPLYFDFSFSFMTDVPYTSMMLVSLYFFLKAMRVEEKRLWIIGSFTISLAFLIRQIAVCIIGGLLLAFLVEAYQEKKMDWHKLAWALGPFTFIITAYFYWLHFIHGPTWSQSHNVWDNTLRQMGKLEQFIPLLATRSFLFSTFIAVFLLPFIIPFFRGFKAVLIRFKDNKLITFVCFGGIGGYSVVMIASGKRLLIDIVFGKSVLFVNIPPWLWKGCFFLGSLCVAAWCTHGLIWQKDNPWYREKSPSTIDPRYRFLLYAFCLHFCFSIGYVYFFDYYCIPILPLMLILLNQAFRKVKFQFPLAVVLVVGALIASTFNTRFRYDYSELVWREGKAMIASGVKPEDISASLAFDGWYNFERFFTRADEEIGRERMNMFSWKRYLKRVFFFLPPSKTYKGLLIRKKFNYHSFGLKRTFYVIKRTESQG